MKHKRGMKYKQISNISKKKTKRFNFRWSHTLKIRFSKIRTKEGLITWSTALKINEENEEKRRGRTTIKVSESQIRESNGDDWPLKLQRSSLNSTDKAAEMDPNFVVRLHFRFSTIFPVSLIWNSFNYIHNTNRHVHENCYKLLDLKSS